MRVLVTGATSLLGGAVARRLLQRGDDVRAFQRRPGPPDVDERLGNIEDQTQVTAAAEGADAIIHLAARVGVTGRWPDFEATNVGGTANVIAAARGVGVQRLVYVSSPSVAHAGTSLVGAAAAPADPEAVRGHYARSKAMAERLALIADGPGLDVVAIRPHLVWGPGDTQLIGRIVDRARAGRLAIVGSGAALVDTTYVDNAADALVAALDRVPDLGGEAFVVSNGQPRPIAELVTRIVASAGLPPPTMHVPAIAARIGGRVLERWWELTGREDDPPMTGFLAEQLSTAHWFDQRESRQALGWGPVVDLDEGFRRLREWFATR